MELILSLLLTVPPLLILGKWLWYPSIPLLALGLPSGHDDKGNADRTAIPSWLLPASPALAIHWIMLAWQKGVAPWKLSNHVVQSVKVDWHQEDLPDKQPPQQGMPIVAWQRLLVWDEEQDACLPLTALRKWESIADPLADEALSILTQTQIDPSDRSPTLLDKLERLTSDEAQSSGETDHIQVLSRYRRHVTSRPPRGAGAIPLSWYAERDRRQGKSPPAWLQRELSCSYDDLIPDEECACSKDPQMQYALTRKRLERQTAWEQEEWNSLSAEEQQEELAEESRIIQTGQDFFYRYSGGILLSLLHFSLAGGFASPRLTGILKKTGYLVPSSDKPVNMDEEKLKAKEKEQGDRTWRRLMETSQWALDIMERSDAFATHDRKSDQEEISWPAGGQWSDTFGGIGRQSSLQVRFLHARVRSTVMNKLDFAPNVQPLNQTDLLSTLLSFSAAPLASLSRMGLTSTLTLEEKEAYFGIWRYAGWLMGVDDRLIRRCLQSPHHADRALWSSVLNLFSEEELNKGLIKPPTYKILQSIADRPPFHRSFELHAALTTSLVGRQLSDALGLPRPGYKAQFQVFLTYMGMFISITFGYCWRSAWDQKRIFASKKLLRRVIVFNLNFKRSSFAGGGGDDTGMTEIEKNHDEAMKDVRLYREMIREMILVCIVVALVPVSLATLAWKWH
ncbi:unnamed protein product [Sympodiomycopsis kandeliae]